MKQQEVRSASTMKIVFKPTARHEPIAAEPSPPTAQIQSMRDYIERHHGEAILSELEEKISSGEIAPRFDQRNGRLKRQIACLGTGQIQNITFRRFSGDEVCAEIVMTMQVMRTYRHSGLDVV